MEGTDTRPSLKKRPRTGRQKTIEMGSWRNSFNTSDKSTMPKVHSQIIARTLQLIGNVCVYVMGVDNNTMQNV